MAVCRFVMTRMKISCQSDLYFDFFSFFFLSKDRHKTKRKPSNAKYVDIKKNGVLKAKADHFENAIDFVWEGCPCK